MPSSQRLINAFKNVSITCTKNLSLPPSIKSLRSKIESENLVIAKADKGNCIVIMNKADYTDKTISFLQENNFVALQSSPLNRYNDNLKLAIRNSTDLFDYFETNSNFFIPRNVSIPKLYSLPKIHKPLIPIRPIVSFIGSPAYKISKFLNDIFKKYLNFQPTYSIKNSIEFCHKLQSLNVPIDCLLVSFDVSNLFPSVPVNECLTLMNSLLSRLSLPDYITDSLFVLLRVALEQDFFDFDGNTYKQGLGLAMGSPLSPFLSEVFMNHLETEYISKLNSFNKHILHWCRYVDDIFAVFQGNETDILHFVSELNNIHKNIKFTYELEINNSLPFLDIKVYRSLNSFTYEIYHKNTATDHVIPYDSNHPPSHKLSAFRSFFHRLFSIPLSELNFEKELNIIRNIALNNGFPLSVIDRLFHRQQRRFITTKLTTLQNPPSDPYRFFSLPYLPPISNIIQNSFKHESIKFSFKPVYTLRSLLPSSKSPTDVLERCGVYRLSCKTCGKFYIGKTERTFKIRFREHESLMNPKHLSNSQNLRVKSNFAYHILSSGHDISESGYKKEFLHISYRRNIINNLEQLEILDAKHRQHNLIVNDIFNFSDVLLIDKLVKCNVFTHV